MQFYDEAKFMTSVASTPYGLKLSNSSDKKYYGPFGNKNINAFEATYGHKFWA